MAVEFKHVTLDHGLDIIAEVNPDAHTSAVGFFVKAGSRDETGDVMGVSHFLEHMMFKGTERRTAADVNREFDEIGANYNASTSQEVTNYYAHVLPEYMERAIDLWTDLLRPTLRDDDFNMEKNVILEEIGMYADRPFWVAYEDAMERYFGSHPLNYRVLGTNESIAALKRDQMMAYFEQRYSPDNMVASLSGNIDFDKCVAQIAEATKAWKPSRVTRDYTAPKAEAGDATITRDNVKMHYMVGLCPGPSTQDDSRYAAAVLAHVLGDSEGSRLYWKLIDPGLADEAELSHYGFDKTGTFMFYASCDAAKGEQVESIMHEVLDNAADELEAGEVERAVSKIAMDMMLRSEKPAGRMMALGGQWLYMGEYQPLETELQRVRAITVDDLRALLAAYPLKPRSVVRLTPGDAT
ncbi:MAG: insulinase family protein [Phycisphaera sp.]|nr:insulinase family protein [Phycisphaera sp.]